MKQVIAALVYTWAVLAVAIVGAITIPLALALLGRAI
jgi:hypothetical protein